MAWLSAYTCGLLFGLGLIVSGMVNPARVQNFLDVAGPSWDPTLAVVFVGALAAAMPAYQWALRRGWQPPLAARLHLPDANRVDAPLVGGAALFGAGWGLAGFCPGPGLTALPTLLPGALAFTAAMFLGFAAHRALSRE